MALNFLDHGGEMGRRIRDHDWAATPFGPISEWPVALRTALGICLSSSIPTAIYWGPELRLLYNDAWAFIPGARHPDCLGKPAAAVWPEIWDVIEPQFRGVLETGEGFVTYDQMLMIERDGRQVESYWNYGFTPILDEEGFIAGIFNQGRETTGAILAERARTAEIERLRILFDQAPSAVAILMGPEHRFELANPAYRQLVDNRDVTGLTVAQALPEVVEQGFVTLLDRVYESGEPYRASNVAFTLSRGELSGAMSRIVDFVFQPVRGDAGQVIGIFVQVQDVTERALAQAALERSEARLKQALEGSQSLGTWDWNLDTGIATADARFAELYGVDPEQAARGAPADQFFAAIDPRDYERARAATRAAIEQGTPYAIEYRLSVSGRPTRWVSVRGSPARDPDTGVARFAGVSFDITERKEAEEAALASAAELRAAIEFQSFLYRLGEQLRTLERADDIMAAAAQALGTHLKLDRAGFFRGMEGDGDLHFVACWTNGRLPEIRGTIPRGAMGEVVRPHREAGATLVINDAAREPQYRDTPAARLSPAGVAVPLMRGGQWVASAYVSQAEPRWWRESEVALIEAVAELAWDGVERAEAVAALRESEAKFRAITNSIDQMVWSTRPDGYHDFYNARWYEYTGVPVGSTDGEAWNGMFHPDDQDRAWARWRHSLDTGEPYRIEYRLRHASGVYRWVLGNAQAVRDESGRITRWFGTCTDIQEIIDAREALNRSREELEQLVSERTDQLMAAEEQLRQAQKMEAVGQLTGGIAHDFNNMLAVVLGGLDLLERRLNAGETNVVRYVSAAREGAERAAALTHRLLAFARRQPLSPRPILASSLIEGMLDLLSRTLGEGVRVRTELDPALWCARADESQLENSLINLCVNARDAMPDGGDLTIIAANRTLGPDDTRWGVAPGDYVAVAVRDTGTGMAPDVLEKALEPFFTTKPVGRGTGLGLSQVFGFAHQSGGGLRIDTQLGVGTTVTLLLPRDAQHTPAPTGEKASNSPMPRARPGEVVMAVEDDPRVRAYTVEALRELGYGVIEADGASRALEILHTGVRPNLLFSDVVMPGTSGRALVRAARALIPELPILLTSGYDRERQPDAAHDPDAVMVLPKPFSMADLARGIRTTIDAMGG